MTKIFETGNIRGKFTENAPNGATLHARNNAFMLSHHLPRELIYSWN